MSRTNAPDTTTITTIDPERSMILIHRTRGSLDLDDLDDIISRIAGDRRVAPGFDVLWEVGPEVQGVPTMELLREHLRTLMRLRERLGSFRTAVVAHREVHYGLANTAAVHAAEQSGIELRTFRSREDAMRWLDRGDAR